MQTTARGAHSYYSCFNLTETGRHSTKLVHCKHRSNVFAGKNTVGPLLSDCFVFCGAAAAWPVVLDEVRKLSSPPNRAESQPRTSPFSYPLLHDPQNSESKIDW